MVTSPTTITPVTTRTTTTRSSSSSPQSANVPTRNPNILDRIRDIVFGLVATTVTGIMAQGFGGNAANVAPILTPARKDDSGRPPFLPIRPPNAKDPADRNRPTQSESVYFDGHVLNISLPVNEDDRNQFGDQEELEEEVGQVVNEVLMDAFQPDENDVPHLKVIVRENGDNIVIEAEAEESQAVNGPQFTNFRENNNGPNVNRPTSEIRPNGNEGRPVISNTKPNAPNIPNTGRPLLPGFGTNGRPGLRPNSNRPIISTRIPNQDSPFNVIQTQSNQGEPIPDIENQPADTQNPNVISSQQPTFNVNVPISTTNIEPRIPNNGGTRENPLRFEPSDAVTNSNEVSTPQTTPLNTPKANEIEDSEDNQTEETLTQDFPEFISAVSEEENQLFDNRLNNILSRSSADIVEATVVEDFDYARRVRESNSRTNAAIGIATISSITIGIISLLIFGLLIFLAIARRRRRQSEYDTTTATPTATTTPSQSRTTVTPSVLADTPSVSYLDDFGHGAPSSLESQGQNPVVPLDGHQTIVASYNDFMSDPNKGNGLAQSMPSPPLAQSGQVPKTKDLADHDDYLFARKTDYYQV